MGPNAASENDSASDKAEQDTLTRVTTGKVELGGSLDSEDERRIIADEMRVRFRQKLVAFKGDTISPLIGLSLYTVLASIGTIGLSFLFDISWWMVLMSYFIWAPLIAIPNCIFIGIQDQDTSAIMGKLTIFIIPMILVAATGSVSNAIKSGLVAEGVVIAVSAASAGMIQDFKTAYYTQTAPHTMFVAQVIAAVLTIVFAPASWLAVNAEYGFTKEGAKMPVLWEPYRGIAVVGAYGADLLGNKCMMISLLMTVVAMFMAIIREYGHKVIPMGDKGWLLKYIIPSPTAFVVVLYLGQYNMPALPVGGAIGLTWNLLNPISYANFYQMVAAALIVAPNLMDIIFGLITLATPAKLYTYGDNSTAVQGIF